MNIRAPASEFLLRSCFGKEGFGNAVDARYAARSINKKGRAPRQIMEYWCSNCEHWHIGGTGPRKRSRW